MYFLPPSVPASPAGTEEMAGREKSTSPLPLHRFEGTSDLLGSAESSKIGLVNVYARENHNILMGNTGRPGP